MIKADFHLHSNFSDDSKTPMEEMIKQGISLGLTDMCITEHMDSDYPKTKDNTPLFMVDSPAYAAEFERLKILYQDKIQLLFGIELGLQEHLKLYYEDYIHKYHFDFIIGSSHLIDGSDPYYPDYFTLHTQEEGYRLYFESILKNISVFDEFDVYGHLDYVIRYGPTRNENYSYEQYQDIFEAILTAVIQKGKGIELNTSGLKYGLEQTHPHKNIIKRYKELGGEIITVGSDAHIPQHICYEFNQAELLLKECGFQYYTIFRERKPCFVKL